jgi:hypothetical protein
MLICPLRAALIAVVALFAGTTAIAQSGPGPAAGAITASPMQASDQDISDAYIYLLGRLLVTRQQQLDFEEGFKWNEIVHRKPGEVDWPNPNLDVTYSEAWVAADESSCTIVTVPKVEGRYYTVHFLNGWGETIANINERLFPKRPFGEFAACYRDSKVALPAGVTRIDLPVKYSRVLARIELGADPATALALQQQFGLRATKFPRRHCSNSKFCLASRRSRRPMRRWMASPISASVSKACKRRPVPSQRLSKTRPNAPVSTRSSAPAPLRISGEQAPSSVTAPYRMVGHALVWSANTAWTMSRAH